MNKFTERLLLSTCYLALQFIAANSSCSNTPNCQCEQAEFLHKYTCPGNNTRIEILENSSTIEIKCEGFEKPDTEYLSYLDEIRTYDNRTHLEFILEGCPLLNTSFMNLFNIPILKHVEKIQFKSAPRINQFEPYHFENLTLKQLRVQNSSIKLSDNAFTNLQNLERLFLENTTIDTLPEKVFANLPNLIELEFEYNNLVSLQKDIFRFNTKLRYLTIEGISASFLPSQLFANLASLAGLVLDNNGLTTLPQDLLVNCTKLLYLSCSRSMLEFLPVKIFQNTTKLKTLNLSYNRLQILDDMVFHPLESLTMLNLAGNRFLYIKSNIFTKLKSLQVLQLNENHLQYFEENAFQNLTNLLAIDLNNNNLTTIPSSENFSPFSAMGDLTSIHLRNNRLTKLFFNLNDISTERIDLDLSYNQFTYFAIDEWLIKLQQNRLFDIDLSSNRITTITNKNIEKSIDTWCLDETCNKSRIVFHLNNNPIKCDCHVFHLAQYMQQKMISPEPVNLPDLLFAGAYCHWPDSLQNRSLALVNLYALQCNLNETHLEENTKCPRDCNCQYRPVDNTVIMDCIGVGLKKLPETAPQLNNSAIELLLGDNNLMSLDGLSSLLSVGNVTKLGLSRNKLSDIHQLEILDTLQVLELDNNQIMHMPSKLIRQLNESTTLISITLHNNPWQCDCQSYDFINFVKLQTGTKKLNNSMDVKCEGADQPITLLQDDLCQAPIFIILICLSLVLLGLLFITMIVLYFTFEYEIKVWMFAHKIFLRLIHRPETFTGTDKLYDAFVSVSSLDDDFTSFLLISQLENEHDHYNLHIQSTDFITDDHLSNRINNAVQNSSRTIIILSKNYLNNEWSDSDFRMSLLKAINEHRSRVIVILLEDVQAENLDTELKAFTTEKILRQGETLFPEKLKYELPHPSVDSKSRPSNNIKLQTDTYCQLKFS